MAIIGTHVSSAKSIDLVFDRGKDENAETIQFFLRSPRAWAWKEKGEKEKKEFLRKKKEFNIHPLVAHGSYLFNLASQNEELRKKSVKGMIEELTLCEELGIHYYVFHPGKGKGQTEEEGIKNIHKSLDEIFSQIKLKNTTLLFETLAGQKGELGKTTQELYKIMEPYLKEKTGICVDTCHIYSAGYKINEPEEFYKYKDELEKFFGLEIVKVIHCNDSKTPFNSHKDRHEHIGEGSIGYKGFELFLNDEYFGNLPFILETPKEGNWDQINMERLKNLIFVKN